MINSVNSTSVQSNEHWRKLYSAKSSTSQSDSSDTNTDQLISDSASTSGKKHIPIDDLFALMQSSVSPTINSSSDTTESEATTSSSAQTENASVNRPPMGPPPEDDTSVTTISSEIDTDGDGSISTAEYEAAMAGESDVLSSDEFFAQVDTDSDGKITADELNAAMKENKPPMGPPPEANGVIPSEIDADQDGSVSTDEYETLVSKMGVSDALSSDEFFKEYDSNSDGEITEEEIIAGLSSQAQSTAASSSTVSDSTSTNNTSSDSTSTQDTTEESLSAQYLNMAAKIINAYETNYEYMFGTDINSKGSIA